MRNFQDSFETLLKHGSDHLPVHFSICMTVPLMFSLVCIIVSEFLRSVQFSSATLNFKFSGMFFFIYFFESKFHYPKIYSSFEELTSATFISSYLRFAISFSTSLEQF